MSWVEENTNKIILGDCLDLMKEIPDKSIDLVLTDPPYGIDYQSAKRIDKTLWKHKIYNDDKPFTEWTTEAFRILKDEGALISFYRWDVQQEFLNAFEESGFKIKSQIVWDKIIHGMGDLSAELGSQHELSFFCIKNGFKFPNKRPTTIYKHQRVNPEDMIHPNEKPVSLFEKILQDLTIKEQIIFDPFSGSGTTAIACHNLKRRFICIEKDPEYHRKSVERYNKHILQERIF
jgi:DNA modification methylase